MGKFNKILTLPSRNYDGASLAEALSIALNGMDGIFLGLKFDVVYELSDNTIFIKQVNNFQLKVSMVSGADLQAGRLWETALVKDSIQSLNGILRIGKTSYKFQQDVAYSAYIDLHTTRNLYITSSSLASYNILSKFGNDVIIKKVAVKAQYGQMLFDSADAGYDFLDVSKRALTRIDFRLQDSYGNIVDLRKNHWSFSLVFQVRSLSLLSYYRFSYW